MNHAQQLATRYIESWNETDTLRRRTLLENIYAEHAVYTDPMISAQGWEAIDATIRSVQGMFPGHVFSLGGKVDAHHGVMRFSWHLQAPDADEPLVSGFDVVIFDDRCIQQVIGFLDKVPALV